MTDEWTKRHHELIDAANAAVGDVDRCNASDVLRAFREGAALATGINVGHLIMLGDWYQFDRGIDVPMCGGIFIDFAQPAAATEAT